MLPVTAFTEHYPQEMVTWSETPEVEFSRETLPDETRIVVLPPTLFREES
jgi:hypothetical protein